MIHRSYHQGGLTRICLLKFSGNSEQARVEFFPNFFCISLYVLYYRIFQVDILILDSFFSPECCGSRVIFKETIPASPFHRQAVGPGFYVRQGKPLQTDISPPARIIDLRMTESIDETLYVKLEWSAPGDDYDRGKGTPRKKVQSHWQRSLDKTYHLSNCCILSHTPSSSTVAQKLQLVREK